MLSKILMISNGFIVMKFKIFVENSQNIIVLLNHKDCSKIKEILRMEEVNNEVPQRLCYYG
jgi:hypothetical protein